MKFLAILTQAQKKGYFIRKAACPIYTFIYSDANKLRVYAVRSAAEPPHKVKLNLTISA